MGNFNIKQNDTQPALRAQFNDGDGLAIVLTDSSVRFHMRPIGSSQVKIDATAVVITPTSGLVEYNWIAADTDTIGSYQAEFEVTYPDGTIETFPNNSYIRVEIIDDIN